MSDDRVTKLTAQRAALGRLFVSVANAAKDLGMQNDEIVKLSLVGTMIAIDPQDLIKEVRVSVTTTVRNVTVDATSSDKTLLRMSIGGNTETKEVTHGAPGQSPDVDAPNVDRAT